MQSFSTNHSKCPKLHQLILCANNHERCERTAYWKENFKPSGVKFFCNLCSQEAYENETTMTCGKCNFDACCWCTHQGICPEHHELKECRNSKERIECIEKEREIYLCNGCISMISPNEQTMGCAMCHYDLCMKCYT